MAPRGKSTAECRRFMIWICTVLWLKSGYTSADSLFSARPTGLIANRQASTVSCQPTNFSSLINPGFCCTLEDLENNVCAPTMEISSSSDCAAFDGNFCCYQSLAKGNSLEGASPSASAPIGGSLSSASPAPVLTPSSVQATAPPSVATSLPLTTAAVVPTTSTTTTTTTSTTPTTTSSTTSTTTTPTTTTATSASSSSPAPINVVTGPGDLTMLDTSQPAVQQLIVDLHNAVRRSQNAANMMEMQWDPVSAQVAQDWANRCVAQHGPAVRNGSIFSGCGQNIANGDGITSWNFTIQIWGPNEQKLFTFGQNPCPSDLFEAVGHYTQMVWARTWQVGCGFSPCGNPVGRFFVCNYCPAGNVGPVCNPYLQGTPDNGGICGLCGGQSSSNCDNGLCTNTCSFTNQFSNCDQPDPNNPSMFPALIPDTSECANTNDQFVQACAATCNCRANGILIY